MAIIRNLDALRARPNPVLALGNFDGVHLGHRAILAAAIDRARSQGSAAFALTFDPVPAKVLAPDRAPSLILTPQDKLELLREAGLDGVLVLTFTHELSRLSPREFVRLYLSDKIGARVVVAGHNFRFGHRRAGHAETMAELGGEFGFATIVVGPVKVEGIEVSSTRIRELIGAGDLRAAARLLGRCHFLRGEVVHGRERGRSIGFPTANLEPQTECLPPDGVYASRLMLPEGALPAITNIGVRPTFGEPERSIEAHVFDFNRDLYGARVKLEMVERIRPEQKFNSGEALSRQIAQDVRRAREILAGA